MKYKVYELLITCNFNDEWYITLIKYKILVNYKLDGWVDGCVGGWMAGWVAGWMEGRGGMDDDLLISKLVVEKQALMLIKSYLWNRWHRTKIKNEFSSWLGLLLGVLQGSIIVQEIAICNFANDNMLYNSDIRLDVLMKRLECAVENAIGWLENNGMNLNTSSLWT